MLSKVNSCAVIGLDGEIVDVEVDIVNFGLPKFAVSLAPADLRKEGPAYDLPIAVGILVASGQVLEPRRDAVFIGELSLNGRHRIVALEFNLQEARQQRARIRPGQPVRCGNAGVRRRGGVLGLIVGATDEIVHAPEIAVQKVHLDAIAEYREGL
jgi:hypothetical protein